MGKPNSEKKKVSNTFRLKKGWRKNLKQYTKNIAAQPKSANNGEDISALSESIHHLVEVRQNENSSLESNLDTQSLALQPVNVEEVVTKDVRSDEGLDGRRIVDIKYMLEEIYRLNSHGNKLGCTCQNLKFAGEIRCGLESKLKFKCDMCGQNLIMNLNKSEKTEIDVNTALVSGAMSVGIGYSNAQELFTTMDIPFPTPKTYEKYNELVSDGRQKTALEVMQNAVREEAQYAVEVGNVDEQGIPLIHVVADGCWSKRSYRKNYSALSGVAAIVGQRFGKVLFIGVRNKYCVICARWQKQSQNPPEHKCYKNFEGSSTSMEADILVEGFKNSVAMYGVKYSRFIADGDSSTYKKILEARPYNNITVEKIECRNHLLRNFSNKLQSLTTDTRYPLNLRRLLQRNIRRMRNGVSGAIAYNKHLENNVKLLQTDIKNIMCHVFGEHKDCGMYFCKRKDTNEPNYMDELRRCIEMHSRIEVCLQVLVINARSLIADVDSNVAEHFNSTVAKFVGGKRVNFSLKGSYEARCSAAVVAFNTRRPHYELHKKMYLKSPTCRVKRLEVGRMRKIKKALEKRAGVEVSVRKKINFSSNSKKSQEDYGELCQKPDMQPDEFEEQKHIFLNNLDISEEQRHQLERDTVEQASSGQWLEYRRKLLTASNFYRVCTRRKSTNCGKLVQRLLYGNEIYVPAILHGRKNEKRALQQLESEQNIQIKECGLFLHKDFPFLGATPDGIVDDNIIVEVKCPASAYKMEIEEAIQKKKITFWKLNPLTKQYIVNTKHIWYYQIQGQLQVTGKQICIFGVWTGDEFPMKTTHISKDDVFWRDNMKEKLCDFYYDCLLPELIDPRHTRSMVIRKPQSILDAQQQLKEKREKPKNPKK